MELLGKPVSGVMLTLLLTGMLALSFNIQPVKASGTIYIRADGSIDPPDAPISSVDNITYTLTGNISSDADGIVVEKSSIVVDGDGYTLQGSGSGNGFSLGSISNVTIKKANIKDFYYGVLFDSAPHNVLSANNIINNQYGVSLLSSNYNSISENNVVNNENGVWVYESNNNIIFGNNLTNNYYEGLDLTETFNNSLLENKINGSRYNFGVSYGFMHLIDVSNLVNGMPIYYLVNQNDLTLNPEILPQVGYLALINCVNITVEGLFLTNNHQGILLANTENSTIENNNITNNSLGIEFSDSSKNVVSENNITNNDLSGVWFTLSNYNRIAGNNITNNNEGIHLCSSSYNNSVSGNNIANNGDGVFSSYDDENTISANNITKNTYSGIKLESSSYYSIYGNNITKNGNYGITLFYSSNDTISGNNITNNYYGISFDWSYNNSISENNLEKNYAGGLYLSGSSNNTFYHNNFIDNSPQIYLSSYYPPGKNLWDNGYPSGGNYWSDYAGVDDNGDGIGDTPYNVNTINVDRYPLAKLWRPPVEPTAEHELVVFLYSPKIILFGYSSLLYTAVANKGLSNETDVELFLLIDDVIVESVTIPLLQTNSYYTLSYNWTPTIEGIYNVTIYTPEISGEENFTNNRFTKFVKVKSAIQVPDDYSTIREAIDAAEEGYTIYVKKGTYYENVIVGKLGLRLVGENPATTIIDGSGESGVKITACKVTVINFTIRNGYYGVCISSSSNNTICGNNVTANNEYGIYVEKSSNNIIDGNFVTKNDEGGIVLSGSSNNTITANNVTDNGEYVGYGIDLTYWSIWGFDVHYSDNNTIIGNNVTKNANGIRLRVSWYNTLKANTVTNNSGSGIHMETASQNILRDNVLSGNKYNFGVFTFYDEVRLSTYTQDIETSNTVDGKPIYYLINQKGLVIDSSDIGYLALVNCTNIHIKNVTLTNNGQGLLLAFTTNSTIENVTIANNYVGMHVLSSDANLITVSTITNNAFGITLYRSSSNNITKNTLTNNGYDSGFYYGCILIGRLVMGEGVQETTETIPSEDNIISSNMISNNGAGIVLTNHGTTRTIINGNTMSKNGEGIYVAYNTSNNKIYHNNFIDNKKQVYIDTEYGAVVNVWDDGYPSGGNYWSNYTGVDMKSGFYQNETGSDGIGDMPHTIDANNTDHYPLMAPISFFNAGTWNDMTYYVHIVSNSTISDFYFNPGEGAFLRFNVTGEEGIEGFCRVTIPKDLLWVEDGWTILVGDQPITDYRIIPDANYTYLYFTYNHSTKTVLIQGTHVIPEFSSTMIPLLFILATLIATVLLKKKRHSKSQPLFC